MRFGGNEVQGLAEVTDWAAVLLLEIDQLKYILTCLLVGFFPFPSSGEFPNPGIKPGSPALQADSLPSELPGKLYLYFSNIK